MYLLNIRLTEGKQVWHLFAQEFVVQINLAVCGGWGGTQALLAAGIAAPQGALALLIRGPGYSRSELGLPQVFLGRDPSPGPPSILMVSRQCSPANQIWATAPHSAWGAPAGSPT